jgi:hypothetical protein
MKQRRTQISKHFAFVCSNSDDTESLTQIQTQHQCDEHYFSKTIQHYGLTLASCEYTILTPNHKLNDKQDHTKYASGMTLYGGGGKELQNMQINGICGTARRPLRIYFYFQMAVRGRPKSQ